MQQMFTVAVPSSLAKNKLLLEKKHGTNGTSSQAIDFNKDSCSLFCSIVLNLGNKHGTRRKHALQVALVIAYNC